MNSPIIGSASIFLFGLTVMASATQTALGQREQVETKPSSTQPQQSPAETARAAEHDDALLAQKREALRGGIFTKALWNGKQTRGLDQVVARPHVTGLNATVRWKDFEPQRGQFQWEAIDEVLAMARSHDLVVTLGIFGGVWTPGWVYEEHRLPDVEFTHTKEMVKHAFGRQYRVPHVWEPAYQNAFMSAVEAMARRYDDNPRVVRVFVSGPSFFFNEFHLESWLAEIMQPHGFTERKYIDGWKRALDQYAKAFPHTPLDLALVPFDGRLEPLEELIDHAVAGHADQVVFSNHSLNDRATGNAHHPLAKLYRRFAELAPRIPIGFELAEYQMSDGPSFSHSIDQQNPAAFAKAIDWAVESGAWFLHPESGRLLNPANSATFEKFRGAQRPRIALSEEAGEAQPMPSTPPANRPNGEYYAPAAREEIDPQTLKVGDMAPDFTLPVNDGKEKIKLSQFRGKKPVVLVFGSITCSPFRARMQQVIDIYPEFADQAQFLMVYIREAHPESTINIEEDGETVLRQFLQTDKFADRIENARSCSALLDIPFPVVVDGENNAVKRAYAGWPIRLVVVSQEGRIAFDSGQGPKAFQPEVLKSWLKDNLPPADEAPANSATFEKFRGAQRTHIALAAAAAPLSSQESSRVSTEDVSPVFKVPPSVSPNANRQVPLAAVVRFAADRPVESVMQVSDGQDRWILRYDSTKNPEAGLPVVGMRPSRRHTIEIAIRDPKTGRTSRSDALEFTTPSLPEEPDEFPAIAVDDALPDQMEPGITLLSVRRQGQNDKEYGLLLAVDGAGEVVWYYRTDARISDFEPLQNGNIVYITHDFRTIEIDLLGNTVASWYAGKRPQGPAEGIPVDTLTFHHEIDELPSGNLLVLGSEVREIENYRTSERDTEAPRKTRRVMGDEIIEFQRNGKVVWRWNAFDHLDPHRIGFNSLSAYWAGRGFPNTVDWTHGNGLDYDERDDSLIVSLRMQDALLKLDRATGNVVWILGDASDWPEALVKRVLRPEGQIGLLRKNSGFRGG